MLPPIHPVVILEITLIIHHPLNPALKHRQRDPHAKKHGRRQSSLIRLPRPTTTRHAR